ncbi:Virulence sensor protein BvgS precursor [Polystyrenella longa]|uniref:histidine kinase n=2 Tax=Polystyrenella longa TaxID=2528007 RepID=A0A518CS47_9PLAN|nr:Virulence sensor protein BvgS precursor [Polystyrenella longa]
MPNLETVQGPQRILILPPTLRDGEITNRLFNQHDIESYICADIDCLCREIEKGAGAVLIAEEHLHGKQANSLSLQLREQPAWSDLPILVLTVPSEVNIALLVKWQQAANVSLIQRPLQIAQFLSVVRSRIQDRKRQYVVRRLLESLDHRRSEFQQLADAMPQMVFITNSEGKFEFLNQRARTFLGYDREVFSAFNPCEVIHADDVARAESRWIMSMESHKSYHCEFRVKEANSGKFKWHLARAVPVRDEKGDVTQWYATCTDIHQRKLAEKKLSEALIKSTTAGIAKSEFLANMSHEIRTPMTAILGYAELLIEREEDKEKKQYLEIIQRNGGFLLDIINDILDLSKIEAGKLEIALEELELRPFIENTLTLLEERANEKEIEFEVEVDSVVMESIQTDSKRLRQILVNLIGNAIKFTEVGRVRLEVSQDSERIVFSVKDTGIGMNKDQTTRLFQPFQQGDASITRNFGGTGLGLAISQRLAKMLGGEIRVISEPGVGSTFSLILHAVATTSGTPIEPTNEPAIKILPESEVTTSPVLNCRVLVVDDRRDVRFLTTRFLTDAGAEVIDVENGLQAVQMVERGATNGRELDLILMDMQMPTMDGYQAASRLRSMGFDKPIIALTADAMQGDMTRCLESGCNAYLSKPINRIEMLTMVAEYVSKNESSD